MNGLRVLFWNPASTTMGGASGREVETLLPAMPHCDRGKRPRALSWTRLWGGHRRRRALPRRASPMSDHVLRDIGLTSLQAQSMGLSIDWQP